VNLRTLLLALLAIIVVVVGGYFVLHGRNSTASAPPAVTPAPTPTAHQLAQLQKAHQRHAFARFSTQVMPLLVKAGQWIDRTTVDVARNRNNPTQLLQVCTVDSGHVEAYQSQITDIPWPPSRTPARDWRRSIFGTLNLYRGAIDECRNVYDTNDLTQTTFAVNDLATAARQIHAEINTGAKHQQKLAATGSA
jgi:hypothetical protein